MQKNFATTNHFHNTFSLMLCRYHHWLGDHAAGDGSNKCSFDGCSGTINRSVLHLFAVTILSQPGLQKATRGAASTTIRTSPLLSTNTNVLQKKGRHVDSLAFKVRLHSSITRCCATAAHTFPFPPKEYIGEFQHVVPLCSLSPFLW